MSKEMVIRCWNCEKKFTISAASANPVITMYKKEIPSTRSVESRNKKKRLLKTCPYCDAENEIYL